MFVPVAKPFDRVEVVSQYPKSAAHLCKVGRRYRQILVAARKRPSVTIESQVDALAPFVVLNFEYRRSN